MRTEFCLNCCHANSFSGARPSFCQGCGKPFNTPAVARKERTQSTEVEADTHSFSQPISNVQPKIRIEGLNTQGTKLGNIMGTAPEGMQLPERPVPKNLKTGEAALQDLLKECARVTESKEVG